MFAVSANSYVGVRSRTFARTRQMRVVIPANAGTQCRCLESLDSRLRGDDAAVSDRCDASRLALGHPRYFKSISVKLNDASGIT